MAGPPKIPAPLHSFIRQHIHSVLQLEVLLWLRAQGGGWTAEEVAQELRITDDSAEVRLRDLMLRNLVAQDPTTKRYSYAPATPELADLVAELDELYANARYTVINLIFSIPGDSARSLAEAFRIRRKDE